MRRGWLRNGKPPGDSTTASRPGRGRSDRPIPLPFGLPALGVSAESGRLPNFVHRRPLQRRRFVFRRCALVWLCSCDQHTRVWILEVLHVREFPILKVLGGPCDQDGRINHVLRLTRSRGVPMCDARWKTCAVALAALFATSCGDAPLSSEREQLTLPSQTPTPTSRPSFLRSPVTEATRRPPNSPLKKALRAR